MGEQETRELPHGAWRRILGMVLIVIGALALITPLTPGSWLLLIGAELLGIRLVFWDRLRARVRQRTLKEDNYPHP